MFSGYCSTYVCVRTVTGNLSCQQLPRTTRVSGDERDSARPLSSGSRHHGDPGFEFRETGDRRWWRVRGADGRHSSDPPKMLMHVIDPWRLLADPLRFAEGAVRL